MYAGTALSNQKKTKRIPVIYMSLLVFKGLAKDKISVGCQGPKLKLCSHQATISANTRHKRRLA